MRVRLLDYSRWLGFSSSACFAYLRQICCLVSDTGGSFDKLRGLLHTNLRSDPRVASGILTTYTLQYTILLFSFFFLSLFFFAASTYAPASASATSTISYVPRNHTDDHKTVVKIPSNHRGSNKLFYLHLLFFFSGFLSIGVAFCYVLLVPFLCTFS